MCNLPPTSAAAAGTPRQASCTKHSTTPQGMEPAAAAGVPPAAAAAVAGRSPPPAAAAATPAAVLACCCCCWCRRASWAPRSHWGGSQKAAGDLCVWRWIQFQGHPHSLPEGHNQRRSCGEHTAVMYSTVMYTAHYRENRQQGLEGRGRQHTQHRPHTNSKHVCRALHQSSSAPPLTGLLSTACCCCCSYIQT